MKKSVVFMRGLIFGAMLLGVAAWGWSAQAVQTQGNASSSVSFTDDADFLEQFGEALETAAAEYSEEPNSQALNQARQKLKNETKSLLYLLNRNSNREHADGWVKFLKLQELQRTLMSPSTAEDRTVINGSLERFRHNDSSLEEAYFIKVREALEEYVDLLDDPNDSEKRKTEFAEVCAQVRDQVKSVLEKDDAELSETIAASFDYLKDCQPNSKNLRKAAALLAKRFSMTNVQFEAARTCFFSGGSTSFSEPTAIRENIRGTDTQGNGTTSGTIRAAFVNNPRQAEIRLIFDAVTEANTVGYSQGVTVYSRSRTALMANKSIFILDRIFSMPATISSQMNAQITGINSGRGNIGTQIVYDRVYEEFPYSKAESQRRAEYRFSERVNREVDAGIARENGFTNLMKYLKENDYSPRIISSSTTNERLYWSALFGNEVQIGPTKGIKLNAAHDMSMKIHASAANNASYFALAGRRLSDKEFGDWFKTIFPGAGEQCASEAVVVKKPVTDANGKKTDEDKDAEPGDSETAEKENAEGGKSEGAPKEGEPFFMTFAQEFPLLTRFEDNKMTVTVRIDQFDQEEKTFPGLDIEVAYEIQERDGHFFLVRSSLEVWPPELDRSASIPARFQAIRTQLLKKLETEFKPEYPVKPIQMKDTAAQMRKKSSPSGEAAPVRGVLVAREFWMKDGWLAFGAEFIPVTKKK